jgi:large conductance mechanosensitive channel protein
MLKGFREFILRGNVVDMAVGVVIGAAFGGIVTAFVKDLLTPLIAAIAGSRISLPTSSKSMARSFSTAIFSTP